jgi:predicted ATPase
VDSLAGLIVATHETSSPQPRRVGLEETVAEHLRERRLLLLLDKFEQLLATAPSLAVLLAAAPDVKLLVTSRAPLRLAAEQEYGVQPFELPNSERVRRPQRCSRENGLFDRRAARAL